MGTTFSSIHIYSNAELKISSYEFKSFSDGWQTCISDFSGKNEEYPFKVAKLISKQISSPILYFYVFDSEYICFEFLQNGKCMARYSDDEFSANKNLYGIPAMLGYGDRYKKRLSNILNCSNTDEKIELLEEYFGVCLLPFPECLSNPAILKREKGDALYNGFVEKEKNISGKQAPIVAQLTAEYKGKLFWDFFGGYTKKEHCFLFGYEDNICELRPVRFCGERLESISIEEFYQNRTNQTQDCKFCDLEYGPTCHATFNDLAPNPYTHQKMTLPNGFYPIDFDTKNRLILAGRKKIYVVDDNMKIIAKPSIKGEVVDMVGDFLLTTTGDSFCGYEYDPKATVRIYRLIEK